MSITSPPDGAGEMRDVCVVGCLITFNGEATIDLAIRSLMGRVHRALVLDSGSADGTVTSARALDATVMPVRWLGTYGAQRNASWAVVREQVGPAREAWIVELDQDELLVGPDLREFIGRLEPRVDQLWMRRRWVVTHRHGTGYVASPPHGEDWVQRVFRLSDALHRSPTLHDLVHGLECGVAPEEMEMLHLDFLVNDHRARLEKVRRYEAEEPGAGLPEYYLYESRPFRLRPLSAAAEAEHGAVLRGRWPRSISAQLVALRGLQYAMGRAHAAVARRWPAAGPEVSRMRRP